MLPVHIPLSAFAYTHPLGSQSATAPGRPRRRSSIWTRNVGGLGDASARADGRFAYPFPGHTWDTYSGHNGIDISFANCYGEPVYAVAAGTVPYTQDGYLLMVWALFPAPIRQIQANQKNRSA